MARLGFVGLGAMGGRMARRLLEAGHDVVGYNRTRARAAWLEGAGLVLASSPRAVAEAAPIVFSMVTDSAALEAVALGPDGLLTGLGSESVLVEMSTVSPQTIRQVGAAVAQRGAAMLDAPVSGSTVTLDQGQLAFMVGGDPAVLERVRPYLLAIGPTITHVGALGLAVTMKIATNLGLAVQMVAFSESVALAEKAGIDRASAVLALLRSVIASPMLKYRAPQILDMPREAMFDVPMMQKDLRLALDLGHDLGVPLPTTAATQQMLSAARALGLSHHDFAAVFDVIAGLSGLPPSKKAQGQDPGSAGG